MKKSFYLLVLMMVIQSVTAFAGFIDGTFKYDNKTRVYSIYVPDIYFTQNKPVPLLVGLHGFGDNVDNFKHICMSSIADTANYICVYAEALADPVLGANAWNSGASTGVVVVNNGVKDNGFINALVDTVIANYKIDTTRLYVFGFSFGGFMTDRLAAENSDRYAAVASVSGLRGNSVTAIPANPVPYLHFHGTSDATIGYYGTSTLGFLPGLGLGAEATVKFWVKQNHCDTAAVIDSMPNLANDGLRFVRFTYNNGTDNSKVIFYKVINGEHEWYGLPDNDISYCQTIWSFFRQFSKKARVTGIRNNISTDNHFKIYPNPSNGITTIDFSSMKEQGTALNIYTIAGDLLYSLPAKNGTQIILENKLAAGMYLVQLVGDNGIVASDKIVIQ